MKKLLIIPLILLCSCSWSKPDLARESLWLLGHYVDYRQTSSAMEQPEKYSELNPLFGKKPSKGRVNSTMALIGAAHLGVTHILKNKKRRREINGIIEGDNKIRNINAIREKSGLKPLCFGRDPVNIYSQKKEKEKENKT